MAKLIAMAGLPGTGKSSIARHLARRTGAIWLRIDSMDQAIWGSGTAPRDLLDWTYRAAQAVATDKEARHRGAGRRSRGSRLSKGPADVSDKALLSLLRWYRLGVRKSSHLAWTTDPMGCQCVAGMPCECLRADGIEEPDVSQVFDEKTPARN
jgi:AAA domain